jgi:hypothetical protein
MTSEGDRRRSLLATESPVLTEPADGLSIFLRITPVMLPRVTAGGNSCGLSGLTTYFLSDRTWQCS